MKRIQAEIFRLTALNQSKSIDLNHITGKSPLIFKEIWVFPNIAGIFPFIFCLGIIYHFLLFRYNIRLGGESW
jgi:hypothetical protein